MAQEAGVDPGVAECQRFPVDPNRPILHRPDQVVGGILEWVEVAAVVPAQPARGSNEHLERSVSGAGGNAVAADVR